MAALTLALGCSPVAAQGIESAIMPGPVIKGHADIESACSNCHVRFDRAAQPRLCLACHKPVAADVRAGTGYHGRIAGRECRSCHTDHKGRAALIVTLDEAKFDHNQSDFALHGRHRGKTCVSCHKPGVKHRDVASECSSCHKKDDKHKGGLGPKCASCHGEDSWKNGRFDHDKTKFPLQESHARAKCADCHVDQHYADTARECVSCHRQDDTHKGFFGNRCASCHDDSRWKNTIFRHDRDTRFPLLDKHRLPKCETCHKAPLYREKTPTRCVACHRADDVHKGNLGERCEQCHAERSWKSSRFDHDRDSAFPLRDKHRSARCESCHKDASLREKLPTRCFACHEIDDRNKGHRGRYGEKCDACHNEKSFRNATFDHDRTTKFALTGKHRKVKCDSCHLEPLYATRTDSACIACHKQDDIHFGSYDLRCEKCHVSSDWRKVIRREDGAGSAPAEGKR